MLSYVKAGRSPDLYLYIDIFILKTEQLFIIVIIVWHDTYDRARQ